MDTDTEIRGRALAAAVFRRPLHPDEVRIRARFQDALIFTVAQFPWMTRAVAHLATLDVLHEQAQHEDDFRSRPNPVDLGPVDLFRPLPSEA